MPARLPARSALELGDSSAAPLKAEAGRAQRARLLLPRGCGPARCAPRAAHPKVDRVPSLGVLEAARVDQLDLEAIDLGVAHSDLDEIDQVRAWGGGFKSACVAVREGQGGFCCAGSPTAGARGRKLGPHGPTTNQRTAVAEAPGPGAHLTLQYSAPPPRATRGRSATAPCAHLPHDGRGDFRVCLQLERLHPHCGLAQQGVHQAALADARLACGRAGTTGGWAGARGGGVKARASSLRTRGREDRGEISP